MTLKQKRHVALAGIYIAGAFFVWLGLDGWTIGSLPAHYLGVIVFGIGIAGSLGVNIWRGGPLDLQLDANESQTTSETRQ